MNREIKFRVWDSSEKCFITDQKNVYLRDCGDLYDDYKHLAHADIHCVIQLYTGLKDRHGKEIYEGDIFKLSTNRAVCIIEYDYCGFVFKWIDKTFKEVRQFEKEPIFKNVHLFEIIGNIYENPEFNPNQTKHK